MKFQPGRTPVQAVASLKEALTAMENAEHCAVLWFAEIYKRKLYGKLGYSSMSQFAKVELQFSRTRIGDYIQLANKLETLPVLRASLAEGKLGPSKAREIIKVATPATERDWVNEATRTSRPSLRNKVKLVRDFARRRQPGAEVPPIKGLLTNPTGQIPDSDASSTPAVPISGAAGPTSAGAPGATTAGTAPAGTATPAPGFPPQEIFGRWSFLSAAEVPVRISVEMMPEQFARYEALLEKIRKLGHSTNAPARTSLLLDGLEALIFELEFPTRSSAPLKSDSSPKAELSPRAGHGDDPAGPGKGLVHQGESSAPRAQGQGPQVENPAGQTTSGDGDPNAKSARRRAPRKSKSKRLKGFAAPVQIHVHQCPECEQATVTTGRGEMPISKQTFERLACDATLDHPQLPNKATIPPSRRRAVLTRDRNRCQAPGCRHTHHLEVHHIVPRSRGGSNRIDNLITLCSGCHRVWHEIGGPPPGWVRATRDENGDDDTKPSRKPK